jgi:hypothetical protein
VGVGVLLTLLAVLALAGLWFVFGGERAEQSSELEARERLGAHAGDTSTPTVATDAGPLTAPPTPGLFRYQGTGREVTTFPPLTENQGPAMPATVTAGSDGCWVVRIDVNTHHWQEWTYCTQEGRVTERSSTNFTRRNLGGANIDNTSTFTCDPAVVVAATDEAGTVRPRSCVGSGSLIPEPTTTAGTITVVGREEIDVGGVAVPTTHVRYDLTYVGAQSGTETTDLWFDSMTGMPVRNEHRIEVDTDTPFGPITYTEDARYALQTPRPV